MLINTRVNYDIRAPRDHAQWRYRHPRRPRAWDNARHWAGNV